jgi:hypothetical protein
MKRGENKSEEDEETLQHHFSFESVLSNRMYGSDASGEEEATDLAEKNRKETQETSRKLHSIS